MEKLVSFGTPRRGKDNYFYKFNSDLCYLLQLNGDRIYLPFQSKTKDLRIYNAGKYVQLGTRCGLNVRFDGKHAVSVVVPGQYRKKMVGLCGDCDRKRNDFRTLQGIDVRQEKQKYALVGNSFSVEDDSDDAPEK